MIKECDRPGESDTYVLRYFQLENADIAGVWRPRSRIEIFFISYIAQSLVFDSRCSDGIAPTEEDDSSGFVDEESDTELKDLESTDDTNNGSDTDECPDDPHKVEQGECGCGVEKLKGQA